MKIAFIHQITTDFLSVTISKKHVIRQNYRRSGLTVCFQTAVNVLEEIQLLVAGQEGQIITAGPLTAPLGAKGRIGQYHVIILQLLPFVGQGVPQGDFTFNIMEHSIHQCQSMSIVYQLTAGEGFIFFKFGHIRIQIIKIIRIALYML